METKIRVIAAIVDEKQLTLYKENGETVVILQGDPRLAVIIKHITPILAEGNGAVAEVDFTEATPENHYRQYEEQAKGGISFFKVAKSRLAGWLSKAAEVLTPNVAPVALGSVPKAKLNPGHSNFVQKTPAYAPVVVETPILSPMTEPTKAEQMLSAAAEVIKHAQPVSHPEFHERDVGPGKDHTIVAVMGNEVVADIEKIKPQLARAVKSFSTKGTDLFMQRCAAVASQRRHPVEDLLKFLEKGDLPIADDGCIVIYKALNRVHNDNNTFVDCHTGKVRQRVGSYVHMDPSMVDPNRGQDCSNGLHVARRSYLGSFSGNVIVLAKVKPEDVIAVPQYNASKMRVCGYHILSEVPQEAFHKLKANQPFTTTEDAQLLLGRALSGDHEEPCEEVLITEQNGGGVKIIPWVTLSKAPEAIPVAVVEEPLIEADESGLEKEVEEDGDIENSGEDEVLPVVTTVPTNFIGDNPATIPPLLPGEIAAFTKKFEEAVGLSPEHLGIVKAEPLKAEVLPEPEPEVALLNAPKVDPKAIVKQVVAIKAEVESRSAKAKRLYAEFGAAANQTQAAQALLDHKKAVKLGWSALGLPDDTGSKLAAVIKGK